MNFFQGTLPELTNVIEGHHTYKIKDVNTINFEYSNPINLEEFCKRNNIKILTLKTNLEMYSNCIKKDFRGVLEGIWRINDIKIEQTDYVLGIHGSRIYGIYKYKKGSLKKLSEFSKKEWISWLNHHTEIGRSNLTYKQDSHLHKMDKTKKVFTLEPLKIPASQKKNIHIGKISSKDEKLTKKLINRIISDKKIKTQNSVNYFGF